MIEELEKAIQDAVKAQQESCKCTFNIPEVELEHPTNAKFGDISTNIAMKIGKQQGENPFTISENLVKQIQKQNLPEIDKIEAVKPGFINFYMSNDFFAANIKEILSKKENFGKSDLGKGRTIVLDYSHPNIAKPIGVHHLITTLIGESVKRTYNFIGAKTIADNFLGDWGTQFGKTIYAFKEWGDKKEIEKDPINELLKLYVRFHEEAEKNSELEEKGREEFKKLEEGDKENAGLWEWMREESIKELKEVYKRLDVSFDYYNGEAFYNNKTKEIIDVLDKDGILETGEGGAKIVDLEKDDLRVALVQKTDGTTLYLTRDLAAIKYRTEKFKPNKIIYVVENAQGLHLAQAFKISEMAGFKNNTDLIHVKFGTMRFPAGKMSTRKGKVVFLWDVLEKAKEKALKIVEEKNPDLENKEEVAEKVGVGAVKYAILSHNRVTDIAFTWDKILSLDGNSAPYLMYTYARAKSILRKAGEVPKDFKIQKLEKEEENLLKKIYQFPEIVEIAAREYMPSHIATYAHELAQNFNTFYNKVPVLNADEVSKDFKLALVAVTAQIIKNSMGLLSIDLPERM